jgi:hypothetical protein
MAKKYLALPGYLVALSLMLFPLVDSVLSIWPPRSAQVAWRFGAVGLLSRAVMTPLLGFLLAYAIALFLGHRRMLQTVAVLSILLGICVVAALGLFGLDALQMRAQVVPQAKTAFDVASVTAVLKYLFSLVVFAAFAWGGLKAARGAAAKHHPRESSAADSPLLVGARPPAQG